MAALSFPSNPSTGTTYSVYIFDGVKWDPQTTTISQLVNGSYNATLDSTGVFTAPALAVVGQATFAGPVTFSGTATYSQSTNTIYTDNILELHAPPGGINSQWTTNDGKDIGFRFHYYNGTDTNAALYMDDGDWRLKYVANAVEVGGQFSHSGFGDIQANTFYGNLTGIATTATYAQTFNTGTLVTNAVNASTSTNAAYAYSFNTGTLVNTAVNALSVAYSNVTGTPNLSVYTTTATVNTLIANSLSNYTTSTLINGSYNLTVNSDGTMSLPNGQINTAGTASTLWSTNNTGAGLTWRSPSGGGAGVPFQGSVYSGNAGVSVTMLNGSPGQGIVSFIWAFKFDGSLVFPDNTSQTTAYTSSTVKSLISVSTGASSNSTSSLTYNASTGVLSFTPFTLNTATLMAVAFTASNAAYAYSFNTSTLVTNAVNAVNASTSTNAAYAYSFNTSTLVTNAVNASTSTNAAYAYSFNTSTLVTNSVAASKLQTARNINGQSFDGTSDITITAAAGSLTGNTLNSSVTLSSLTSVGTLSSLSVSGDITTTQTTANIFNSVASTINIGGASSAVNIGYTGNTTINNLLKVNYTGVGSVSSIWVTGNNTKGGAGYHDFLEATNVGQTNPNKFFRLDSAGTLQILNSGYSASLFEVTDGGIIKIGSSGTANTTNNSATTNALNFGSIGQIFSDGNFHIHSATGSIWINALDNSSVRINTQTNSGSGGGLVVNGDVISLTPCISKTAYNAGLNTEITAGNMKFRITGSNYNPQVISNTGGNLNVGWSSYAIIYGVGMESNNTNNGVSIPSGSWTTLYSNHALANAGDQVVVTILDKNNKQIYRVTFIRSDDGANPGSNIIAERLF